MGTWKEQDPETTPQDEQLIIMLIEIVHYDQFETLYGQKWGRRLLLAQWKNSNDGSDRFCHNRSDRSHYPDTLMEKKTSIGKYGSEARD
ncbi:hypothetical protein AYJ08_01780 [Brevibacillus sp. SKDU10]|uniref:hypothetical protein n=1 Tax=Brevibacillus sp. SKDU10 TaxID=1247872 RepID=UPI0007C97492|nr:hypothetical protein [Brevibacillus sp. SKDU10]OAJ72323.1 hypothetical protein AYJ08_01780 [Brevibacillus sp. SKDU10]